MTAYETDHAAAFTPILERHRDWLEGEPHHSVFECEPGWAGLMFDLFDAVAPVVRADEGRVEIRQIKEKYGVLSVIWRAFVSPEADAEIEALIDIAELRSAIECEVCGQPARLRGKGWVQTLCDHHAKERGRE